LVLSQLLQQMWPCIVNCWNVESFGNEGRLKVTTIQVHCKFGNILEMVQDGVVVTRDH